uniref:Gypsy retrotransposon integrase-like protein 1 n=1 Tax=Oreochromis niloticus TaxID=8128 RepID=A0A669BQR8_ORENI
MERLGIVQRSNSAWASPLHMVPKSDGRWRPCGDFRRLNNVTANDRYPIPHIQDFSAHLAGTSVFSKIDLVRGYHQVPVRAEDVPKTAVITPFGLFEFLRMPFGLKGAAQTFQRLMDSVLRGLPFVFVYLDDILVASSSKEQHMFHLCQVFQRLAQHGLIINPSKCQFGLPVLDFLGHRISAEGAVPLPDKVRAVSDFPRPTNVKALQEFLGMVNFYNRFLLRAAHLLKPLYGALKGKKANDSVHWFPESIQAFSDAKSALANAALLAHPSPSAPIALTTDASDIAVGVVLEQRISGVWQPLAFFSRTLRDSERIYSVFDRELLALHLATRHFRFFLEGRHFTAYVDHKPLTFAMSKVSDPWSARRQRQLAAISEFTTDIRHVAGKSNHVADCLSRALVSPVFLGIDYSAMAADQSGDPDILALKSTQTGLILEDRPVQDGGPLLVCDVSTSRPRPVVPVSWRRQVFDSVHALSHPGVRASVKLVSSKFVWPGLRKSVKEWASACIPCQCAKVHKHTKAPLEQFFIPGKRFDHVHVDLVGPLPQSQGFTHLLTVVHRTTRWPEAVPLASTTAAVVAKAFLSTWVSRFGPPADITSDRGPQFISELWSAMADGLGAKVHRTTAYNPQANGMCERFHRSLKAAFRASLQDGNWVDRLPCLGCALRLRRISALPQLS